MPETLSHASHASGTSTPSRIGVGLAGGFYPAPHRYRLYLAPDCPRSLRVSITLDLLGLGDSVTTTALTHPDGACGAFDGWASLRSAYEATWHHYEGPLVAPALCDRWTGRVVSNHTPDILRDLAGLADRTGTGCAALRPQALARDIEALRELLDTDVVPAGQPRRRAAALDLLDRRLASSPYASGRSLTAADVDLWVALVHLGTPDALAPYAHLRGYVSRLATHPAFRETAHRGASPGGQG